MYPIIRTCFLTDWNGEKWYANVCLSRKGKEMARRGGFYYYLNKNNRYSRRMVKSEEL